MLLRIFNLNECILSALVDFLPVVVSGLPSCRSTPTSVCLSNDTNRVLINLSACPLPSRAQSIGCHGCMKMHSSLLEGAPQGAARQIWWDEKLAFQFEEDDDEQAEEAKRSTQTSAPPNEPSTATAAAAGDSAVTGSDIMEVAEERRVENMNDVIESAEPASVANTDDDVDEPDAATALDHGTAEAYGSPQKVESMDETHTSASSSITSTEGSLEVP